MELSYTDNYSWVAVSTDGLINEGEIPLNKLPFEDIKLIMFTNKDITHSIYTDYNKFSFFKRIVNDIYNNSIIPRVYYIIKMQDGNGYVISGFTNTCFEFDNEDELNKFVEDEYELYC